jgi:hypothetical protein
VKGLPLGEDRAADPAGTDHGLTVGFEQRQD